MCKFKSRKVKSGSAVHFTNSKCAPQFDSADADYCPITLAFVKIDSTNTKLKSGPYCLIEFQVSQSHVTRSAVYFTNSECAPQFDSAIAKYCPITSAFVKIDSTRVNLT